MYSNICITFYLFLDLSCSNDYGVPYKFAQATRSSRPLLCDVTLPLMNRSQTNTWQCHWYKSKTKRVKNGALKYTTLRFLFCIIFNSRWSNPNLILTTPLKRGYLGLQGSRKFFSFFNVLFGQQGVARTRRNESETEIFAIFWEL